MVPQMSGVEDNGARVAPSLGNRVKFKAPVTYSWKGLPVEAFILGKKPKLYTPPTPFCCRMQLNNLGKSHPL